MNILRVARRLHFAALSLACGVTLAALAPRAFSAAPPSFDLAGPRLEMTVDRAGHKLPISQVAGLQAGDRLWIHPLLPADQSIHFLLIVAFLQGTTNPPPEKWFIRVETWSKQIQQEGTVITVPQGAQQALMFLAPETGGDFSTLRSTVRGRPGVFVRATRDLEQASLDRTRLDEYLEQIRQTSETDPAELKRRSALLAQTLHIKVDEECFKKPVEQQTSCLTQNSEQLVIDDAHSESVVAMLTSGPSSDLISALGASPVARGGYYSPYFGAVVDVARLMNKLHTATYQYLPALSLPDKDELNLKLNSPPSFQNPKSVLVIGLPAIGTAPKVLVEPYLAYARSTRTRSRIHRMRNSRVRPSHAGPRGQHFDLQQMFDDLNARYFAGSLARPEIGWSTRAWRRQFGCYDPGPNQILLNPRMDRARVPRCAVEYVLFHEMLHVKHPTRRSGCTLVSHSREFREEERRFEHFARARRILDRLAR